MQQQTKRVIKHNPETGHRTLLIIEYNRFGDRNLLNLMNVKYYDQSLLFCRIYGRKKIKLETKDLKRKKKRKNENKILI